MGKELESVSYNQKAGKVGRAKGVYRRGASEQEESKGPVGENRESVWWTKSGTCDKIWEQNIPRAQSQLGNIAILSS